MHCLQQQYFKQIHHVYPMRTAVFILMVFLDADKGGCASAE